ncbi:hypothetical protein C0971_15715 [Bacillus methanolicus]|uniref:hypothetical protein n=1 Tax=Bacillus methanolicus TaxID=1471 RepID=UPI00200D864D|nr:hypothetical protein [Bacillus methanolicus]UQD53307.1 hypothetical protein C0971_15715 [Bacillus methanolicus]
MKSYLVLSDFIDKYTKKYYSKGAVYPANDEKRAIELQEKGFLGDAIAEEKDSSKERTEKKKRSSEK